MNLPEIIPVGAQGWRIRKTEIFIIQIMGRSAKPQTVWTIRNKLGRKENIHLEGKQIFNIMDSLYKSGYIDHIGFDNDKDSLYVIK